MKILAEAPTTVTASLGIFEELESEVRSYIRTFNTVFTKAKGHRMWDTHNREYIDFFAGAGALNYGHNDEGMKQALLQYVANDGVSHSLDMATKAKAEFLEEFRDVILQPRSLNYKVMFPGPTGTNAVESALKLARKVTGRTNIMHFTNSFHGMTLGSLSVTGNHFKRQGAGIPLNHTAPIPYDNYLENDLDTTTLLSKLLDDHGSGFSLPAAVIVETVQGEGGVNVASFEWLRKLEQVCRDKGILLIVDDVQMGCGRTGPFFSFEQAGIKPDMVCLSKSISGYGLPMALTLFRRSLDLWEPGEHNGTFRGHNLAFVTARKALDFWKNKDLERETLRKGEFVRSFLRDLVKSHPNIQGEVRGRGMINGIKCNIPGLAERISQEAFRRGLIIETSGPENEVVKLLPPLTISDTALYEGLTILAEGVHHCEKMSD